MQTALYGKIKEIRKTGGQWWIGGNTHNVPFYCNNSTEDKTKVRKAIIDEDSLVGTQSCKARVNDGYEWLNENLYLVSNKYKMATS